MMWVLAFAALAALGWAVAWIAVSSYSDLAAELDSTRVDRDGLWDDAITLRRELRDSQGQNVLLRAEVNRLRGAVPRDNYVDLTFERIVRGLPGSNGGAA